MADFKFELGAEAKDGITGFYGIIIGRAEHLTGCNTYGLQPKMKKDAVADARWVDEQRIVIVGKKRVVLNNVARGNSGDPKPSRSNP